MRHKIVRWRVPGLPRRHVDTFFRHLAVLRPILPPRVMAAIFGTVWNRWTTARRFQQSRPCLLGCSPSAQDSIEHYAHCAIVRQAASSLLDLQLRAAPHALGDFLLLTTMPSELPLPTLLGRMSILVYAVYSCTNALRFGPSGMPAPDTVGMLNQAIFNGAQGHAGAEKLLREVWRRQETGRRVRRRMG